MGSTMVQGGRYQAGVRSVMILVDGLILYRGRCQSCYQLVDHEEESA